jgi:tRNA(Arg) A34 adenosine deaminase TadA
MKADEHLGPQWSACLRLALQALDAGSLAIAAVIANSTGEIISSGRNQLFDNRESANLVRNTLVSHAELNAIAALPVEYRKDKSVVMYTTMEPCPMCMGAVVMSSIRNIRIAIADPWAGAVGLLSVDRYMGSKKVKISFEEGLVRDSFFYINMISQRRRLPGVHPFYLEIEKAFPLQYRRIEVLEKNKEFMDALTRNDANKVLEVISGL